MRAVMSFVARAVESTGDANLGLRLAQHADVGSADVHFYAIVSSPTLGAAYERVCRYQRLIQEHNRVELDVQGDRASLRHVRPGGLAVPRHTAEFLLAVWVRAGRLATRLPHTLDRVLRYLVVTPDLHRVHHSARKPETNSNFGAVFPIWDLIFGTFNADPRGGHEQMRLGLDEVRGRDAHRPLWLLAPAVFGRLGPASAGPSPRPGSHVIVLWRVRAVRW